MKYSLIIQVKTLKYSRTFYNTRTYKHSLDEVRSFLEGTLDLKSGVKSVCEQVCSKPGQGVIIEGPNRSFVAVVGVFPIY